MIKLKMQYVYKKVPYKLNQYIQLKFMFFFFTPAVQICIVKRKTKIFDFVVVCTCFIMLLNGDCCSSLRNIFSHLPAT